VYIKALIEYNVVQVLVQIRGRRIQTTIRQQKLILDEPDEQRNIVNVSMVSVAPNFVVLAAGYVTAIFRTVDRAKCPWKHIEMLVMWKSSKKAAILILNAAVQLTAVSIKLSAARNDIFTYYCMILFNGIFFSVSR
jgi:hypothetical protein